MGANYDNDEDEDNVNLDDSVVWRRCEDHWSQRSEGLTEQTMGHDHHYDDQDGRDNYGEALDVKDGVDNVKDDTDRWSMTT